jgi:hypothetical protein
MPGMAGAGVIAGYLTGREVVPTPQCEPLRRLSRTERAALQRIAQSPSERVDHVRRAVALLPVACTGVFIHAARECPSCGERLVGQRRCPRCGRNHRAWVGIGLSARQPAPVLRGRVRWLAVSPRILTHQKTARGWTHVVAMQGAAERAPTDPRLGPGRTVST